MSETRQHHVAVLALERALPMEVGMPFQIFEDGPDLGYDVNLCGRRRGPVATTGGFTVQAVGDLTTVRGADTVIVPAFRAPDRMPHHDVLEALRDAHAAGSRIVSICTGAFALAAAGLLDGRRATTHWRHATELAERYPAVVVDPDVLFVDEGSIVTSAGVASGIDVCLHLLRVDHGASTANRVARSIVAAPHRDGGQAQYIPRDEPPQVAATLAATRSWALGRLTDPITVATLARHACTSERTFARVFAAETGTTPLRWLNAARVDRARELLETTDWSIDRVSAECGLGTAANLRTHFRRILSVAPADYRRTFARTNRTDRTAGIPTDGIRTTTAAR